MVATTTTTTQPVTVVCSGSLLITTTVTLAPTSVGLTTSDEHDVVLLPKLIPRDPVRGSVGLITLPQQPQPKSQMPSQAYATYAVGPLQVCFSFRFEPPSSFFYYMLVYVMVFAFCFQVPK